MDPQTATYYRAILFADGLVMKALPPSLLKLHAWTLKRTQAMGLGGVIAKQTAMAVALTWLSSTKEGRAFARENLPIGELFSDEDEDEDVKGNDTEVVADGQIDWAKLEPETPVIVQLGDTPTPGIYMGRRSSWIDVLVNGERKSVKRGDVKLAGA